jgi:chaperonin GroEL (HSP60 family)
LERLSIYHIGDFQVISGAKVVGIEVNTKQEASKSFGEKEVGIVCLSEILLDGKRQLLVEPSTKIKDEGDSQIHTILLCSPNKIVLEEIRALTTNSLKMMNQLLRHGSIGIVPGGGCFEVLLSDWIRKQSEQLRNEEKESSIAQRKELRNIKRTIGIFCHTLEFVGVSSEHTESKLDVVEALKSAPNEKESQSKTFYGWNSESNQIEPVLTQKNGKVMLAKMVECAISKIAAIEMSLDAATLLVKTHPQVISLQTSNKD